jgi:hypothetical protein
MIRNCICGLVVAGFMAFMALGQVAGSEPSQSPATGNPSDPPEMLSPEPAIRREASGIAEGTAGLVGPLRPVHKPSAAVREHAKAGKPRSDRSATMRPPAKGEPFAPKPSATEQAIREALEKTVAVQVQDVPLAGVIEQIRKATNVRIVLDRKSLSESHVEPTTPITLDASGRTLRAVLDELVHNLGQAWTFDRECLLITSPDYESCRLVTRCYDISDFANCRNKRGEGVVDFDSIISLIKTAVDATSWDDVGGAGSISPFEASGICAIVISQTWRTQLKIESLLASLQALRGRPLTKEDIAKLPLEWGWLLEEKPRIRFNGQAF